MVFFRTLFLSVAGTCACAGALITACSSDPTPAATPAGDTDSGTVTPGTDAGGESDTGSTTEETPQSLAGCTADPGPPASTFDGGASATDPVGGAAKFTIADALAGYPDVPGGVLTALITTEKGTIRCELFEAVAPISVANFVGLARGTRPYKADGVWKVGRFYDGLLWHRVIPDFVIQGGDPLGTGSGGPGYNTVAENQVDEPLGTLAQAAATFPSGSQFYIVVGKGPAANYNVFGTCSTAVAKAIAGVPSTGGNQNRPKTEIHMQRIDIARCPK